MSVLPDSKILHLGSQLIEPFNPKSVQPASYDLTLDPRLLVPPIVRHSTTIDLRTQNPKDFMREVLIQEEGFELPPGACVLASTIEVVRCPVDMVARVEGKSSLGRLFLAVHVTAGFVDPGFEGQITLEIVNHGPWSVILWPGMKIAQVNFARMTEACAVPYGSKTLKSHYQGQRGPTAASGKRDNE